MAVVKASTGQNYFPIVFTVKPMTKGRKNSYLASFILKVSFSFSCHPVSCSDPRMYLKGIEQRMLWALFQAGGAHQCDSFTEECGYRVVAAGRKGRHAFFPKRIPASIQLFSEIMCNSKKIHLRIDMNSRPLFLWTRLRAYQYSHEKDHKQWLQMRQVLLHTTHGHTGALHTGCCESQNYLRVKWD